MASSIRLARSASSSPGLSPPAAGTTAARSAILPRFCTRPGLRFRLVQIARSIQDFHGKHPAGHFNDRSGLAILGKMLGKTSGINRCGGHDHLQIVLARPEQQALDVTQKEVDVQAALMRLVDDQAIISPQLRIRHGFSEQDAIGHQLDAGAGLHRLIEAHLVTDMLAERRTQLFGDALGNAVGGNPARLCMADQAFLAGASQGGDFGQLGGFARAGLTTNDDDRMRGDRTHDLLTPRTDGQLLGELKAGKCPERLFQRPLGRRIRKTHQQNYNVLMNSEDFVRWLRAVAPYIHAFRGKTFVVGLAGELVAAGKLNTFVQDLSLLAAMGMRIVVVHGSRPQVAEQLRLRGVEGQYANGLRITDAVALECAKEASGEIRLDLEAAFSQGLPNTPMAHSSVRVISGNFILAKPVGILNGVDHLHTGQVRKVDATSIRFALESGAIVLLSPAWLFANR